MRTQSICLALAIVLLCPVASAQWKRIALDGRSVTDITVSNETLFVVTGDIGSVYRSTNGGGSWNMVLSRGASQVAISHLTGTVFVAARDTLSLVDTVYRSIDHGNNWTRSGAIINVPPVAQWFTFIEVGLSGTVFCGKSLGGPKIFGEQVMQSTDDGLSWSALAFPGHVMSFHGEDIAAAGTYVAFGGGAAAFLISLSTDDGGTWVTLDGPDVAALSWSSAGIFFSCPETWYQSGGIFLSSDTCKTAKQIATITATSLLSLPISGILAATNADGVFYFSDNGDSLGSRNDGLTNLTLYRLAIDSAGYVYAATADGVFRRPISELTGVRGMSNGVPSGYILLQNYPNPFNPTTVVSYQLPAVSDVHLMVYDILGREVAVLVNEKKVPGMYEVRFDATGLASGVYLYRLTAGNFVQTRKMVVVK